MQPQHQAVGSQGRAFCLGQAQCSQQACGSARGTARWREASPSEREALGGPLASRKGSRQPSRRSGSTKEQSGSTSSRGNQVAKAPGPSSHTWHHQESLVSNSDHTCRPQDPAATQQRQHGTPETPPECRALGGRWLPPLPSCCNQTPEPPRGAAVPRIEAWPSRGLWETWLSVVRAAAVLRPRAWLPDSGRQAPLTSQA